MAGNIGKLRVVLGLNDKELRTGLKANQRLLATFGRGLAIAGAAAGAAAIGGLTLFTKQSFSAIDAQAKLARDLSTTTASMQVMERAGDLAGVSMGSIEVAMRSLTLRLGQAAEGAGPAVTALDRLGLSADQLLDLPLDQRMALINSRLEEFVPAASRASVGAKLFGERGALAMARLDGSVLQQATDDVTRFGVAVSDVDAAQIEKTNDALSRMSLIGQGLGNQIAVAVAPALERMAEWMATIAQVGGPLNTAINLVVGNLDRLAIYAAVVAGGIGVKVVGSLVLAAAKTFTFAGALRVLRTAIIRTGIGALIIGAVELGIWFGRLVKNVGGFGTAMGLLKDVAAEAWDRMKAGVTAFGLRATAAWTSLKADVLEAVQGMLVGVQGFANRAIGAYVGAYKAIIAVWEVLPDALKRIGALAVNGLIDSMSSAIGGITGLFNPLLEAIGKTPIPAPDLSSWKVEVGEAVNVAGQAASAFGAAFNQDYVGEGGVLDQLASEARAGAETAGAMADIVGEYARMPMTSVAALRDAMSSANVETEALSATVVDLSSGLEDIGGSGGGGGGSAAAAAAGVADIGDAATETEDRLGGLKSAFGSFFENMTSRSETLSGALKGLLENFSRMASDNAFEMLWSGGSGGSGGLSGLLSSAVSFIPGFASGTQSAPGGFAQINERGGEIVNLPNGSQVIPHDLSEQMVKSGGSGSGRVELVLHTAAGVTVETIVNTAGAMISSATGSIQKNFSGSMNGVTERGTS